MNVTFIPKESVECHIHWFLTGDLGRVLARISFNWAGYDGGRALAGTATVMSR